MTDRIVPLVTPFRANKPDIQKLAYHARKLLDDGVDYLFLAGTTGLGPSITPDEKLSMLDGLREFAPQLILQVGSLDLEQSIRMAEEAKRSNIHAIAAYPPYFFPRITEEWVVKYFVTLSKIYPLFVYNYPLATGFEISPAIVRKMLQNGGNVIGVKDTLPDLAHMLSFKYELGNDFIVYSGPDTIVTAAVRSGINGSVAGSGNYAPELLIEATNIEAKLSEAILAQKTIAGLGGLARKYGQWAANYSLVKIIRGYDVGEPRTPIYPLGQTEEEKLSAEVQVIYPKTKRSS
jgi:2-dehydro-3-deoxy-phosphogluconate/2-dehydro-3-deoxy-6-phosphogalactonate aldolase